MEIALYRPSEAQNFEVVSWVLENPVINYNLFVNNSRKSLILDKY